MTSGNNKLVVSAALLIILFAGILIGENNPHLCQTANAANPAERNPKEGKKVATDQAETFRLAARTIAPSVVNITTIQKDDGGEGSLNVSFIKLPKSSPRVTPKGIGSGFVFDGTHGYVITNYHVVSPGNMWVVRCSNGDELEATLVGTDPQTDVAVLKVDAQKLQEAALGDSDGVQVGDWVLAVGNPFGLLEQTVTAGIISAKGRRGLGLSNYEDYLQTDAAINMGNSGGPLVNLDGEVIGITSAIFSLSGGYQGIGFAIPINQARSIAQRLIDKGSIVRGWLGIQLKDLTPSESRELSLKGPAVAVEGIYIGGPAQKAGIQPGDVLIKFDQKAVKKSSETRDLIASLDPGTHATLTIQRNGKTESIHVVIGTQPKNWGVEETPD